MQIFLKTEQNSSLFVWKRISVDGALADVWSMKRLGSENEDP